MWNSKRWLSFLLGLSLFIFSMTHPAFATEGMNTIEVIIEPEGAGTVTQTEGNYIVLTANPVNGYWRLARWELNGEFIQDGDAGSLVLNKNTSGTVTAVFEERPTTGQCGDNLFWFLDISSNELIISGTGDMWNWSYTYDVPWYDYCIIQSINDTIKKVIINNGVTSIGSRAFAGCSSMTSISIEGQINSIGERAFNGCSSLSNVTIPNAVTIIGKYAFCGCSSLSQIVIPVTMSIIQEKAFLNCKTLLDVYYCGDKSDWAIITIEDGNTPLVTATRHYKAREDILINPFEDVKPGKYYYSPVLWAYYHLPQVTSGAEADLFGIDNDCTREQIVTFLWKAAGAPEPTATTNPFTDVNEGKYYYKPVLWAVEKGITGGVGEGKFGVGQSCTREQAVTFLWIAAGRPEPKSTNNPFDDVPTTKYFYKPVLWAVENGITGGVGGGKFGVGQTCTRAQIVTFLYKYYGKQS